MKLKDFDYVLPASLIAQAPLKKRDQAKLLVIDRTTQKLTHDTFANIGEYLPKQSEIVCNNSKVVAARLLGSKTSTGAKIEIFLIKKLSDYTYETLLRPLKRLKEGDAVVFDKSSLKARIIDRDKRIVRFNKKNISDDLSKIGHMPLPPYIKREDRPSDKKDYQTVYAKKDGSVAAPTAGLHFTKGLIGRLEKSGHHFNQVTLHVNYGTFKPVEVEDITKHPMHTESYAMTKAVHARLCKAKDKGRPVVAVGTTSCRTLEAVTKTGKLKGATNIFIYPGFSFKMVDHLITNFHLPRSTLLMLVSAFAGRDLMMKAYAEAKRKKYRFYSYGDAMLIL